MIGLALGLAYAHPGMDDRLAAGAGSTCDVEEWLSLARGFADEHRIEEADHATAQAAACGADPAVIALYRALRPGAPIADLDAAVAANPDHAGVRLARSRALARLGRTDDAIGDAERALAPIDRPQPDDLLYLSRLHTTFGDREAALAVLDDGISRIGPAPALVDEALTLELALGRPIAALARLDGLPRTPTWLAWRSTVLLRSGATAEADAAWAEAVASTPRRPRR